MGRRGIPRSDEVKVDDIRSFDLWLKRRLETLVVCIDFPESLKVVRDAISRGGQPNTRDNLPLVALNATGVTVPASGPPKEAWRNFSIF